MKSNILIVSLVPKISSEVSVNLSKKLDMVYLNVNELIDYEVSHQDEMKLKCGIDYVEKQIDKVVLGVINYTNTIIDIEYKFLIKNNAYQKFSKDSYIIFLKNSKQQLKRNIDKDNSLSETDLIAYEEHIKLLESISNIIIDCKNKAVYDIINNIKQELNKLV
jgi:hypothetical protein